MNVLFMTTSGSAFAAKGLALFWGWVLNELPRGSVRWRRKWLAVVVGVHVLWLCCGNVLVWRIAWRLNFDDVEISGEARRTSVKLFTACDTAHTAKNWLA